MVFTIKKVVFFLIITSCLAFAATKMTYTTDDNSLIIKLNVSIHKDTLKIKQTDKALEFDFVTDDVIDISQEFWGIPVSRVYSKQNGKNVKLFFDFIDKSVKPDVNFDKEIFYIKINFPKETKSNNQYKNSSVYYRLIVGLLLIIVFILIIVFFTKIFMKKKITSELPGVGRVLGKVDVMPGKSLVFFELTEYIYILGLSGDNIRLIDKITNEIEINKIKMGFESKGNFSSYLKFFTKNDLDKELDVASTVVRDKVNKLKKK
jgi:flagellar biogenesis protein FliO